jgi:hypothetical protein
LATLRLLSSGLCERCALIIQKAIDLLSQAAPAVASTVLPVIVVSDTGGTHQSKRQGSPPGQIGTLKFTSL